MENDAGQEKTESEKRFEEETELWLRCSVGDEDAREELILAYRPMVYWLAKKLRVPYNTYPDLIQEGMVAVINAVDTFDISRKNHFSTYAYYKIKGRMINFLQRVEAKAPVPADEAVLTEEDMRASAAVMSEADRTEWTIDLQQALGRLSEREADIVTALVLEGRKAKEIAAEINIDVSHVYRIRRKAVGKLRKWLGIEAEEATTDI